MRGYILIVLLAASTAAGHACSCTGPQPVCAIEMGTSAIFRGIVVERTLEDNVHYAKKPDGSTVEWHGGGRYRVRFAVEETFSGEPRQEMTVYTNSQGSACGFPFEDGGEYVVFTHQDKEKDALWTSRCSRTAKLRAGEVNESMAWMRA